LILDTNPPLSLVRELFIEYSETPGVDLCLKTFAREMETLPDPYVWFVVAMENGSPAGCGALRSLGDTFAELKRLYVRPAYRRSGIGRSMAQAAVDEARARGFRAIRLDTLGTMASAIALYRSMGFREIGHYGEPREAGLRYFELVY
jgi:putative acetyltransferase